MAKTRIVILSGPSGSGKTTLYQKLLASRKFKGTLVRSLSVTTRARRQGEQNGRDYLFVSKKDFLKKRQAGYFLEWQKVFTSYYGTPKAPVAALLRRGKNVLLCIDVKGAKVVWKQCPQALKIFVKTPSLAVLKARLKKRATEHTADLKVRLATAAKEMKQAKHYDYVLVNDDLPGCYRALVKILSQELLAQDGRKAKKKEGAAGR